MSYRGWVAGAGALALLVAGGNVYKNKVETDLAAANVRQRSAATVATVRKPVTIPDTQGQAKASVRVKSVVRPITQVDAGHAAREDALFYSLQAAGQSNALSNPQPNPPVALEAKNESVAEQTFALAALDPDKSATQANTNSLNLAAATADLQASPTQPNFPSNGLIYVDRLVPSVPEPDSHALLLVGLGLLGVAARARRGRHLQQSPGETNTL